MNFFFYVNIFSNFNLFSYIIDFSGNPRFTLRGNIYSCCRDVFRIVLSAVCYVNISKIVFKKDRVILQVCNLTSKTWYNIEKSAGRIQKTFFQLILSSNSFNIKTRHCWLIFLLFLLFFFVFFFLFFLLQFKMFLKCDLSLNLIFISLLQHLCCKI